MWATRCVNPNLKRHFVFTARNFRFHYFFRFQKPRSFRMSPILTFDILTQICLNVHFWTQNFSHFILRFPRRKSFAMSSILYDLDDFLHVTSNKKVKRRIFSYLACLCNVCTALKVKNRYRPIRGL